MKEKYKKVLLIILDGFGLAKESESNPINREMVFLDSILKTFPSFSLEAAGLIVGLPAGNYGNSEVGHSAIGTGRIIVQDLARINRDIETKEFFENTAFKAGFAHAKKFKSNIHIVGCVSPGGIHSHEGHLEALLELYGSYRGGFTYIHFITDGEDSKQGEAVESLKRLRGYLKLPNIKLATVIGRKFGMDRLLNWELTQKVWKLMVKGEGEIINDGEEYIKREESKGVSDHDVEPVRVRTDRNTYVVGENDVVVFFNYRNDRIRQLAASFLPGDIAEFDTKDLPKNLKVITMTNYDERFVCDVAYPIKEAPNSLGEVISNKNIWQLRVAEQEKAAHVTNFFNGSRLMPFIMEDRTILPSKKLSEKVNMDDPTMAALEITESIIENLNTKYSLIVVNYANPDMIAHSGDMEAVRKTLLIIDNCLKKIIESVDLKETTVVITADHGNAEELVDPMTGEKDTQHSTSNVPMIVVGEEFRGTFEKDIFTLTEEESAGALIDVAPTVLKLMGIEKPVEMTGRSLI